MSIYQSFPPGKTQNGAKFRGNFLFLSLFCCMHTVGWIRNWRLATNTFEFKCAIKAGNKPLNSSRWRLAKPIKAISMSRVQLQSRKEPVLFKSKVKLMKQDSQTLLGEMEVHWLLTTVSLKADLYLTLFSVCQLKCNMWMKKAYICETRKDLQLLQMSAKKMY